MNIGKNWITFFCLKLLPSHLDFSPEVVTAELITTTIWFDSEPIFLLFFANAVFNRMLSLKWEIQSLKITWITEIYRREFQKPYFFN